MTCKSGLSGSSRTMWTSWSGARFTAANRSDDPIDLKFLLTDAVVTGGTTVRGKIVQRGNARVDRGVEPNAAGVRVAKTLHVAASNGTARRERDGGEHRSYATPERFESPSGEIANRQGVSEQ